jgi:hypothetical protein
MCQEGEVNTCGVSGAICDLYTIGKVEADRIAQKVSLELSGGG